MNAKPVLIHELQPGDVFADPSGGASLMVTSVDRLDRQTVALAALQLQPTGEVFEVGVFAAAFDTAYVPDGYPSNEPIDLWPTDTED